MEVLVEMIYGSYQQYLAKYQMLRVILYIIWSFFIFVQITHIPDKWSLDLQWDGIHTKICIVLVPHVHNLRNNVCLLPLFCTFSVINYYLTTHVHKANPFHRYSLRQNRKIINEYKIRKDFFVFCTAEWPENTNIFSVRYPARTQFEKNRVGNPVESGHFEHSVTWRRDRNADPFQEFMDDIRKVYPVYWNILLCYFLCSVL